MPIDSICSSRSLNRFRIGSAPRTYWTLNDGNRSGRSLLMNAEIWAKRPNFQEHTWRTARWYFYAIQADIIFHFSTSLLPSWRLLRSDLHRRWNSIDDMNFLIRSIWIVSNHCNSNTSSSSRRNPKSNIDWGRENQKRQAPKERERDFHTGKLWRWTTYDASKELA